MKKNFFTLLVLIAGIMTFSAMQSGAHPRHPRLDSAIQVRIDSFLVHHPGLDSIVQAGIDSFKAHHDSIRVGRLNDSTLIAFMDSVKAHCKLHHDSIPPIPHDSLPPAPHDSFPPFPHDSFPPLPPPHGHDSIPPFPHDSFPPPPPPPPHDSTGCGGQGGYNGGHGRRIEVGDDATNNITIGVYPNPISSNSVLHIANSSGSLTFRMFDITGKIVVMKENLSDGDYSITSGNLGSGMYFYDVFEGNTKVSSGKLLVQ